MGCKWVRETPPFGFLTSCCVPCRLQPLRVGLGCSDSPHKLCSGFSNHVGETGQGLPTAKVLFPLSPQDTCVTQVRQEVVILTHTVSESFLTSLFSQHL